MYKLFIRSHKNQNLNGLASIVYKVKADAIEGAKTILAGQIKENNVACRIFVFKDEAELCIATGVEVNHSNSFD